MREVLLDPSGIAPLSAAMSMPYDAMTVDQNRCFRS
jgi:hypothetical protein